MQTVEHDLKTIAVKIDLDALPDDAQRELVEFYEFLVFKYHRKRDDHPEEAQAGQPSQTLSKWAKIVQRVQSNPVPLAGYAEQLQKDMSAFRHDFEFKHAQ